MTITTADTMVDGKRASLLHRLPIKALTTLAVRIAAAGLTYFIQIALARTLGESGFGLFSLAWVYVMLGGYLGCLGLSQTAVRFLPGYRDRYDLGREAGFLRFSIASTLLTSCTLMFLALGGLFFAEAAGIIGPQYHWPLVFGALCLPFFAFQDLLEGLARARGQMLRAFFPPFILRGLFLLAVTFALLYFGAPATASTAMAGALGGTVLAAAIQAWLVLKPYRRELRAAVALRERALWLKASIPLFLADGALMLRQNVDILLLGLLVEPHELGIYFAASRIVALLGLIEYSVASMTGPRFSIAAAQNDKAGLASVLQESGWLVFWPTVIGAAVLIVAAPYFLSLFGGDFASGAFLVIWLVFGPVLRALAGSTEEMLNMLGHGTASVAAHVTAFVIGAALMLMLTPVFGLTGAAIAASAGAAANGAALMLLGAWKTGLVCRPWPARRLGRSR
jgi:O-antigen/teichoic acid export membrane protein